MSTISTSVAESNLSNSSDVSTCKVDNDDFALVLVPSAEGDARCVDADADADTGNLCCWGPDFDFLRAAEVLPGGRPRFRGKGLIAFCDDAKV